MFRIGIIGSGNRIVSVIEGINAVAGMRVAALSDPCEASVANALARLSYAPEICGSNEALLRRQDIDGVIVATPNDLHVRHAVEVISSGKPLYLEKPMAIRAEECDDIIEAARAHGVPMMIGMQLRYSDVYRKMKALCDDGAAGEIKMLMFRALRGPFRPGVDGWRMRKQRSGGTILEVSVHQLDLFNWFAGAPLARVSAFGANDAIYQNEELLDRAVLTAEYQNGVQACLQASVFAQQGGDDTGLCIVGTKATLYHTAEEIVLKTRDDRGTVRYPTTGYRDMDALAMRGFMEYVRDGAAPLTSAEAGRAAVVLALAAERSIEEGRVVPVGIG